MIRRTAPLVPLLLLAPALLPATPLQAQSLRGSRSSIQRMYEHALDAELHFFRTGRGIREAAEDGALVRLRANRDYTLDGVSYPYARPTTKLFVERLAAQYRDACGERLVVTSAARPRSMRLRNSTQKTVHPTGMAVDFRKSSRTRCRNWLRSTLLALESERVLEATEEHYPAHFHVAVFPRAYRSYLTRRGVDAPRAPVTRQAAASTPRRYTVRSGDSLWSIARRQSTSVARLKEANALRSSRIQPGQVLTIPSGK
jgi:hypothetical protein